MSINSGEEKLMMIVLQRKICAPASTSLAENEKSPRIKPASTKFNNEHLLNS